MLKLNRKQLSFALAALLSFQMLGMPVLAQPDSFDQPLRESTLLETRVQNESSGLKAYDDTPLGDRMPLVLVHGIGGTATKLFHWEKFLAYTRKRPDFNARYKIYLFHYDSTRPVPELGQDLQRELRQIIQQTGNRHIKVLAYSEGGLLTRNAMQDRFVYDHTDTVLTIATPFHGSPLANPEWLSKQVEEDSPLSLVRMTHKLAYDITGRRYPTFRQDFHWDNFDNAIPASDYLRNNGPNPLVDYALDEKKNFITYGSFFGVDGHDPQLSQTLDLKQPLPQEEPKFNLFRKNILFTLIRKNIAKLPLARDSAPVEAAVAPGAEPLEEVALDLSEPLGEGLNVTALALAEPEPDTTLMESRSVKEQLPQEAMAQLQEPVSMMAYNDGISPISSSLWLGRFTPQFRSIKNPVDRLWAALRSLKGNKTTRLFAGLDHRNWMDGVTRTDSNTLKDLLNPDEQPKTVFEWIVQDLMG